MSLVNQMLQDLERRRTLEAGISPLSGLSSSGAVVTGGNSINYLMMGAVFVLAIVVALVVIDVFGLKQSMVEKPITNIVVPAALPVKAVVSAPTEISNAERKDKPGVVQSEVVAKHAAIKISPDNPIQPSVQLNDKRAMPAHKVVLKEADDADLKKEITTGAKVGAGFISIHKAELQNESLSPSVAAMDDEKNQSTPGAVNKTIRPLTSEQQAQVAFQDAVKLLGRGDESGAQQKLEKALSIHPVHLRARETLSALLLNTGRVSEAAETLSEGLRLRPTATALAKLYARVLVDQGDNDTAVAVLERARPSVATDPDYYALLAALYRSAGKHAQASQAYQQILQIRPGVAVWWMGLALAEDAMGSSTKALEAYQRAQRSGGLKAEVLQYVQSRIAALAPNVPEESLAVVTNNNDGFGD